MEGAWQQQLNNGSKKCLPDGTIHRAARTVFGAGTSREEELEEIWAELEWYVLHHHFLLAQPNQDRRCGDRAATAESSTHYYEAPESWHAPSASENLCDTTASHILASLSDELPDDVSRRHVITVRTVQDLAHQPPPHPFVVVVVAYVRIELS